MLRVCLVEEENLRMLSICLVRRRESKDAQCHLSPVRRGEAEDAQHLSNEKRRS